MVTFPEPHAARLHTGSGGEQVGVATVLIQVGAPVLPAGRDVLEFHHLPLAEVDGHQVVLQLLINRRLGHKEGLHVPEGGPGDPSMS